MERKSSYITTPGAAQLLELSKETVKNYIAKGLIRTVGSGTNIRLLRKDVEKLLEVGGVRDTERNRKRYLKALRTEERRVFEDYLKKQYQSRMGLHSCNIYARQFLDTVLENMEWKNKDLTLIYDLLHGISTVDIAKKEKCTAEAIRLRYRSLLCELNEFLIDGASCRAELEVTKQKLLRAKEHIRLLKNDRHTNIKFTNIDILQQDLQTFFGQRIPTRDYVVMFKYNIKLIADIVDYQEKELLALGVSQTSLDTIGSIITQHGLSFRKNTSHLVVTYAKELNNLYLSRRTLNGLHSIGICTIGELMAVPRSRLSSIRSFGKKCLGEIDTLLSSYNLTLS